MQPYKTLAADGYAYYEIQKSKFHAYTAHVESEAEARGDRWRQKTIYRL